MQPYLSDALLQTTTALSTNTSAVTGAATDLNNGSLSDNAQVMEWEIQAPALNTTQLPDNTTYTYAVMMSPNSDMSGPTLIYDSVAKQTGAGGAGSAAVSSRFRLPFQPGGKNASLRYLAVRATPAASPGNVNTGNCAAASVVLVPYF